MDGSYSEGARLKGESMMRKLGTYRDNGRTEGSAGDSSVLNQKFVE